MAKIPSGPRGRPVVHGAAFSVYVQAVCLVLAEKGIPYDLREIDPFAPGGPPADYLQRHPFGLIPAFEDGHVRLYESEAIARYVDEAYPGPALQPSTTTDRALMSQTISVLRSYAYPTWVRTLYVQRVVRPLDGIDPDEDAIARAMPRACACASAIGAAKGDGPSLVGGTLTLADCFAAPMFACLMRAPERNAVLADAPKLLDWWDWISARESVRRIVI